MSRQNRELWLNVAQEYDRSAAMCDADADAIETEQAKAYRTYRLQAEDYRRWARNTRNKALPWWKRISDKWFLR